MEGPLSILRAGKTLKCMHVIMCLWRMDLPNGAPPDTTLCGRTVCEWFCNKLDNANAGHWRGYLHFLNLYSTIWRPIENEISFIRAALVSNTHHDKYKFDKKLTINWIWHNLGHSKQFAKILKCSSWDENTGIIQRILVVYWMRWNENLESVCKVFQADGVAKLI